MRILIISKDLKRPIRLRLPMSLLKSRLAWQSLIKNNKDNNFDFKLMYKVIKKGYKELKKYVKTNGHFTLVNIVDSEGNLVRIII